MGYRRQGTPNAQKTGRRGASAHHTRPARHRNAERYSRKRSCKTHYCTNQANGYSISIECCHPDSTGKFNEATEQSLAELCAYLLEKFGLGTEDIIRHYDVTGKQCPLYWSPTPYQSAEVANARFTAFKNKVAALGKDKSPAADGTFLVRILDPALNIRAQPSLNAKINGVISDKGVYTIVATSLEPKTQITWGKLKSGAGWISLGSKYVKKI